jgi:hypothetical protein
MWSICRARGESGAVKSAKPSARLGLEAELSREDRALDVSQDGDVVIAWRRAVMAGL